MTSKSESFRLRALLVAVVLGVGLSVVAINYMHLSYSATKIAFKDVSEEKLLSVHPLTNGLVELSLMNSQPIVIRTNSSKAPPAVINSDIGYSAVKLND